MKDLFDTREAQAICHRIDLLNPDSQRLWGKMDVARMLAHLNVTYELVYDKSHPKPNRLKKFILKALVKPMVIGEKPFKKNGPTASEFKIVDSKDFYVEKSRLIQYITKTQELGADFFDGKESHSFGALSYSEWNMMFYKHLDHHLTQFDV